MTGTQGQGPSLDRLRGAPPRVEGRREPAVDSGDPSEGATERLEKAVLRVPAGGRLIDRARAGTRRVEERAAEAGMPLLPTESARLRAVDATAEKSVHDYLKELDRVKTDLDLRKKEVDGLNSFASKIDRRIKDAGERKSQAEMLYTGAQGAYQEVLDSAKQTDSGRKALQIHEARLKFAELEARMKGRSEALTYSWTPSGKLTRFEQLRADFLSAKKEYFELRGEIASEHLDAVLHEQIALADARALEIARSRKGEHTEQEKFDGLDRVNQVGLAIEKGLLAAYQGWDALGQMNIARATGWQPDTFVGKVVSGLSVRTGISMGMVAGGVWVGGAFEVPAAASALVATAARKGLGAATSGKGFYDLMRGALLHKGDKKIPEADELLTWNDGEVDKEIFALESKAVVNGVQPSTLEGYKRLHAERARRVQHQLAAESDARGGERAKEKEAARTARVKTELQALLAQTEARFETAKKASAKGDTRLKVVAGALGAFFASGVFMSGAKEVASVGYDAAKDVGGATVEAALRGGVKVAEAISSTSYAADDVPEGALVGHPSEVAPAVLEQRPEAPIVEEYPGEPDGPVRILPDQAKGEVFVADDGDAAPGEPEPPAEAVPPAPEYTVSTVSLEELRSLFRPEIPDDQKMLGLYSLVKEELGGAGLQKIDLPHFHLSIVEQPDGTIHVEGGASGIPLGTVDTPNMKNYAMLSGFLDSSMPPVESPVPHVDVAPVTPEDPTWKFDRARSTGMFADEYEDAAKAAGKESVRDVADRVVHTPDDAIDRLADTIIHAVDSDDEITRHPDTLPNFQEQEAEALAERRLEAFLHSRQAAEEAVWQSPPGLTAEAIAEAHRDVADNVINLPDGTRVEFVKGEVYLSDNGVVSKEDSIKALLNPGYKDMIRGFMHDVGQDGQKVEDAIKNVESHIQRMMNMMKVRDYMVAHGLQDDPHFAMVQKELEDSVKGASRHGHVIYDDPYYGQPSGGQKADKVYQWATGIVDVRVQVEPGHNPGRPE